MTSITQNLKKAVLNCFLYTSITICIREKHKYTKNTANKDLRQRYSHSFILYLEKIHIK